MISEEDNAPLSLRVTFLPDDSVSMFSISNKPIPTAMQQPQKSSLSRPKRIRRGLAIVSLIAVLLLLADYAFYPWGSALTAPSGDHGENGLWIRYTWYFGQHRDTEITQLASDCQKRGVAYAYFHVRYIGKSGNLRFHYPDEARHLNQVFHKSAPGVKSIAWIFVGNTRAGGAHPDLSDAALRRRMVAEAKLLVTEYGFDGVQWDYEICPDGDTGLLALLEETRADLPEGATISLATALWSPVLTNKMGYGWSEEYFAKLAARTDQLCVMGYDSGFYLPRAYAGLMAEQVRRVCRATVQGNSKCRVLIGVPTYSRGGASHHAPAENLRIALRGVREGYGSLSAEERAVFAGIALFADYTTQVDEWHDYETLWQ
ncbi:MAG: hypothetical protein EON58_14805 [Alphaproteobacteria bacterium]|nr:MAG: hypothetical protein EON58_14805 [Alphaproteobacteria bacterium]